MNPYVLVFIGEQSKSTRKAMGGGSMPNWKSELVEFEIPDGQFHRRVLHFEVRDGSAIIGTFEGELAFFTKQGIFADSLNLNCGTGTVGKIKFRTRFLRSN